MSHDEVILLSSSSSEVGDCPPVLSCLQSLEDSDIDLPFVRTEGLALTSENDVPGSSHTIDIGTSDSEEAEFPDGMPLYLRGKELTGGNPYKPTMIGATASGNLEVKQLHSVRNTKCHTNNG